MDYTCSICGNSFNSLDDYLNDVNSCVRKVKEKEEKKNQEKYIFELNAEINKVKQAENYYNECLKNFKEKYPKEYDLNFNLKTHDKNGNNNIIKKDDITYHVLSLEDFLDHWRR